MQAPAPNRHLDLTNGLMAPVIGRRWKPICGFAEPDASVPGIDPGNSPGNLRLSSPAPRNDGRRCGPAGAFRELSAHLPRHPCQPQRPPRSQLFIAVTEKTCAGASMIGLPRWIALLDRRRGRPRHPPRDVRTIRLYSDDVNPAKAGRAKLPI
jgi:hypothetical protein